MQTLLFMTKLLLILVKEKHIFEDIILKYFTFIYSVQLYFCSTLFYQTLSYL